jgi:hypothetical protein
MYILYERLRDEEKMRVKTGCTGTAALELLWGWGLLLQTSHLVRAVGVTCSY